MELESRIRGLLTDLERAYTDIGVRRRPTT